MRLWATYSDGHTEVDAYGDRDGLRALANAASQPKPQELTLDEPPLALGEQEHRLESIRIEPHEGGDARLRFGRDGSAFVISGSSRELARIVGGSIGRMADGPERKSGIPSHLHLDPTSDPDRQFYAPRSGSLTVGFDPTEV